MPEMTGGDRDDRFSRDIDAALAELTAVEPSPDFLPRLRAHVERISSSPSALSRWLLPAAVVTCAIVAAFIIGYDRGSHDAAPPVRLATVPPPSTTQPSMPADVDAAGSTPLRTPAVRAIARRAQPAPSAGPDVLVPASERQAIGRLAEALRAGRPEALSIVGSLAAEDAVAIPIQPVSVSPIRIDPVVVPPVGPIGPVSIDPPDGR